MGRASPKINPGTEAVEISVTMLRLNIDLGSAGSPGQTLRARIYLWVFRRLYATVWSDR
jgi:hypothetical protein